MLAGRTFWENDTARKRIDYRAAVSGDLRLVPSGTARQALAEDYATMLATGMLLANDEPIDTLMQQCVLIEERAHVASVTDR